MIERAASSPQQTHVEPPRALPFPPRVTRQFTPPPHSPGRPEGGRRRPRRGQPSHHSSHSDPSGRPGERGGWRGERPSRANLGMHLPAVTTRPAGACESEHRRAEEDPGSANYTCTSHLSGSSEHAVRRTSAPVSTRPRGDTAGAERRGERARNTERGGGRRPPQRARAHGRD